MKRILLSLMLSVFALMSFAQTDNIFHEFCNHAEGE